MILMFGQTYDNIVPIRGKVSTIDHLTAARQSHALMKTSENPINLAALIAYAIFYYFV